MEGIVIVINYFFIVIATTLVSREQQITSYFKDQIKRYININDSASVILDTPNKVVT